MHQKECQSCNSLISEVDTLKKGDYTPKFLVIHPIPTPITLEEGTPVAKAAKANSTVDAYWVRSWAQLNEEGKIVKILCEWNAANAEAVSQVLTKVPAPSEGPYPMAIVDSEDYR